MRLPTTSFKPWLLALASLGLSACATDAVNERLAFSDAVIRDYGLTEGHKSRLQYYTSDRIRLARASSTGLRGIGDGKLIERGNTQLQGVDIPEGAPGIVVGSGPNWLAVSFDPGSYLYFVSSQPTVNSPYWRDRRGSERYYLYAPDWDGRAGSVKLGNEKFQAVESSINTYLLVDREALYDGDSRSSTLSGRWLDGISRR